MPHTIRLLAALLCLLPARAVAQGGLFDVDREAFAGSEVEGYLRLLQNRGVVQPRPWSIRALSPAEVGRLAPPDSAAHPWSKRYGFRSDSLRSFGLQVLPVAAGAYFNSGFPYGFNDGAVWAGRGTTLALAAGAALRWGALSLVVRPEFFRAENRDFPLAPNGLSGDSALADDRRPTGIDLPQRFGDGSYQRVEPGQSTLRIDTRLLTVGVSTANQYWGPAETHPMLLGNNAPGFVHAFVGTGEPLGIGIGRLHSRVVWGRLEQSDYSLVSGVASRRFMSGVVATFTPHGIPGLEVGAARFFHVRWPEDGLSFRDFLKPFESVLKVGLSDSGASESDNPDIAKSAPDNQLASAFARWVFPRAGFEVYGEYAREDHNFDFRDLVLNPDQHAGYTLGFRKAWAPVPHRWVVARGEIVNAQVSHLLLVRDQTHFYVHSGARQGHTQRGQVLGSAAAYGGAGSVLALDLFHRRGRWTIDWNRILYRERQVGPGQLGDREGVDVSHAVGAQALLFLGRFDLHARIGGVYELNRYLGNDAFNLNLSTGGQWRP